MKEEKMGGNESKNSRRHNQKEEYVRDMTCDCDCDG